MQEEYDPTSINATKTFLQNKMTLNELYKLFPRSDYESFVNQKKTKKKNLILFVSI